jgi:hypothetical protein
VALQKQLESGFSRYLQVHSYYTTVLNVSCRLQELLEVKEALQKQLEGATHNVVP